jgi:hypothetical protein
MERARTQNAPEQSYSLGQIATETQSRRSSFKTSFLNT